MAKDPDRFDSVEVDGKEYQVAVFGDEDTGFQLSSLDFSQTISYGMKLEEAKASMVALIRDRLKRLAS